MHVAHPRDQVRRHFAVSGLVGGRLVLLIARGRVSNARLGGAVRSRTAGTKLTYPECPRATDRSGIERDGEQEPAGRAGGVNGKLDASVGVEELHNAKRKMGGGDVAAVAAVVRQQHSASR